jgi:alpha-beta hydrolase superfamily lysophospholipase
VWETEASPRARAVFLHGIISHGGWYGECAARLAAKGIEVHYLDRRGSGLNADQSGDVDRWQTWIEDVAHYLGALRGTNLDSGSCTPTVLCGISWGGKLAVAVGRKHAGLVNGMALICPGIYSPFSPGLLKKSILRMPVPPRLQNRRVRIPLRKAELFTDNAACRQFIDEDPLTLRKVTWRFAREDCQLTRYAKQAASHLHMPLLLVLAGRDRIVNNRRLRQFFLRTHSAKRTLIEYPTAAHTLEFEIDPSQYFADLGDWVAAVAVNPSCG